MQVFEIGVAGYEEVVSAGSLRVTLHGIVFA